MCLVKEFGKYIVNKCLEEGCEIDTSKLQKMLFYAQKKSIKDNGSTMFDSKILAWRCGVAINEIYKGMPEGVVGFTRPYDEQYMIVPIKAHKEIINFVLEEYGKYTTNELIELSKKENCWIETWDDGKGVDKEVSIESIKHS